MTSPLDTFADSPVGRAAAPESTRAALRHPQQTWSMLLSVKRLAAMLLVLMTSALVGCGPAAVGTRPGDAPRVERGELQETILLTGELVAEDSVVLEAPNANIWPLEIQTLVVDGTEVEAGQIVAEFDNSRLTSDLTRQENQVASIVSTLESTRSRIASEIDTARFEVAQKKAAYDRAAVEADLPEGLVSPQELANKRLSLETARLELEQSERALESAIQGGQQAVEIEEIEARSAYRELEQTRSFLERLTLRAPRAGVALVANHPRTGRPLREGTTIFPGASTVTIPELSSLYVESKLSDVDDGRVTAGQSVIAVLDAFPDLDIAGTVRSVDAIAEAPEEGSSRRSFKIAVDLESVDVERMRPGMSVKVMVTGSRRSVLLVPRQALDWTDANAPTVRLVGGGSAEVEIGVCDALACEVLQGLDEGQQLASAGAPLNRSALVGDPS